MTFPVGVLLVDKAKSNARAMSPVPTASAATSNVGLSKEATKSW